MVFDEVGNGESLINSKLCAICLEKICKPSGLIENFAKTE